MRRPGSDRPNRSGADDSLLFADAENDLALKDDAELLVRVAVLRQLGPWLDLDDGERQFFAMNGSGDVALGE